MELRYSQRIWSGKRPHLYEVLGSMLVRSAHMPEANSQRAVRASMHAMIGGPGPLLRYICIPLV